MLEAREGTSGIEEKARASWDASSGPEARCALRRGPLCPAFQRHVERAFAAVAAVGFGDAGDVVAQRRLGQPVGDPASQHPVAADALAGDHQHRAPAVVDRADRRSHVARRGRRPGSCRAGRSARRWRHGPGPACDAAPRQAPAGGRSFPLTSLPLKGRAGRCAAAPGWGCLAAGFGGGVDASGSPTRTASRSTLPTRGRDGRLRGRTVDVITAQSRRSSMSGARFHGSARRPERCARAAACGAPGRPLRRPPRHGRGRGRRAPRP